MGDLEVGSDNTSQNLQRQTEKRKERASEIVKLYGQGYEFKQAFKKVFPRTKAAERNWSRRGREEYDWFMENFRENFRELLATHGASKDEVAKVFAGAIAANKSHVFFPNTSGIESAKEAKRVKPIIVETPDWPSRIKAVTVLTDVYGERKLPDTNQNQIFIYRAGDPKKRKPKPRRVDGTFHKGTLREGIKAARGLKKTAKLSGVRRDGQREAVPDPGGSEDDVDVQAVLRSDVSKSRATQQRRGREESAGEGAES